MQFGGAVLRHLVCEKSWIQSDSLPIICIHCPARARRNSHATSRHPARFRHRRPLTAIHSPLGGEFTPLTTSCIALLGREDKPTDAVDEYCHYLAAALQAHDLQMEIHRVSWEIHGWPDALRALRFQATKWRDTWVLLQYTALGWSARGFPQKGSPRAEDFEVGRCPRRHHLSRCRALPRHPPDRFCSAIGSVLDHAPCARYC